MEEGGTRREASNSDILEEMLKGFWSVKSDLLCRGQRDVKLWSGRARMVDKVCLETQKTVFTLSCQGCHTSSVLRVTLGVLLVQRRRVVSLSLGTFLNVQGLQWP